MMMYYLLVCNPKQESTNSTVYNGVAVTLSDRHAKSD